MRTGEDIIGVIEGQLNVEYGGGQYPAALRVFMGLLWQDMIKVDDAEEWII